MASFYVANSNFAILRKKCTYFTAAVLKFTFMGKNTFSAWSEALKNLMVPQNGGIRLGWDCWHWQRR